MTIQRVVETRFEAETVARLEAATLHLARGAAPALRLELHRWRVALNAVGRPPPGALLELERRLEISAVVSRAFDLERAASGIPGDPRSLVHHRLERASRAAGRAVPLERSRFGVVVMPPATADVATQLSVSSVAPPAPPETVRVPVTKLDALLDLVALGTVADVVKLDANNRRLVAQGLKRVRSGRLQPGLQALFSIAGRDPVRAAGFDFGFALGPRINAAGRLSDMTLGIECLATDDSARATELAGQLDAINRERRDVEAGMRELAERALELLMPDEATAPPAVALFDESFHEGVVGIVAGRVKDRLHRPTFVFARGTDGNLKGSGRSIPGFHLRDALDLVAKREPGLLLRFGGHAMAAGCTLDDCGDGVAVERFGDALRKVAAEWLDKATLTRTLRTDGPLAIEWFNPQTVAVLDAQVWGQGFEAPVFCDEVQVLQQRLVGEKHLKLRVRHLGQARDAIWFGHAEPVAERLRLAYRLVLDEYNGQQRLQMIVEAAH